MDTQQHKIKIPWKERAYTDWAFGMYPTPQEQFMRKCVIYQFIRFVILSIKFHKTASINE